MRVRDDDFTNEEEEASEPTQPEEWQFEEVIPGQEEVQGRNILIRAVSGAYRALNNWLSGRTRVEFSDPQAEYVLAASVVDWAWKEQVEITPFQNMLFVHATHYGPRLLAARANNTTITSDDQVEEDITQEDE